MRPGLIYFLPTFCTAMKPSVKCIQPIKGCTTSCIIDRPTESFARMLTFGCTADLKSIACASIDTNSETLLSQSFGGEKFVLVANGKEGVATVIFRPSGILGEGDHPLLRIFCCVRI